MDDSTESGKDPKKDAMAGINFFVSILLMGFSVVVVLLSLAMPRPGGWSSGPGLIPLFLGATIFFMSIHIFSSSLKKEGYSIFVALCKDFSLVKSWGDVKTRRTIYLALLIAFFVFGLLGRIAFEIATFIYLLCLFLTFWRKGGWVKIILLSALVPLILGTVFRLLFSVSLPGGSTYDLIVRSLRMFK